MKKKKQAELKKVVIFCPKLKKHVTLKEFSFSATNGDCDTCGSHGDVTLTVTCLCGRFHDIQVNSW